MKCMQWALLRDVRDPLAQIACVEGLALLHFIVIEHGIERRLGTTANRDKRFELEGYRNAVDSDGWPLDPEHPANRAASSPVR